MRSWEKNIRKVIPYVPGEQPKQMGIIKLNTNENPYPPAPGVAKALRELDADSLRRYPDPSCGALVEELAGYYHLEPEQVFVGVGSDDVLAMCFLTFFHSEKPVFFPDITYSFYDVWADVFRIPYECQPLNADFEIVKEDYYRPNGGVIFPNPNAPTGMCQSLEDVEDIISHNQDVVVIVEAKERSGSLITADFALEQGKDIYAVPGRVTDSLSMGCNNLIRQGAGIINSVEDFVKDLELYTCIDTTQENFNKLLLEKDESLVYACLSLRPKSMEELLKKTGFAMPQMADILQRLIQKDFITESFKNYYIRKI